MYARYRTRSRFYKMPSPVLKAYNVNPNIMRKPHVKEGLLGGVYRDKEVDLRDRDRLELLESIRHPRERDFYQDHTYHNQWIDRSLDAAQRAQLGSRYAYFAPNYVVEPWVWYPGDVVEVVRGEGTGQRGAIIAVIKYKNEVVVQNVNVQDVTIPASETRPEQVVQREHPINIDRIRHVDPSTDALCDVELVRVRNKDTGALEEKRISLQSGVLLPIPPRDGDDVAVGDPLKDTPMADAEEATYRAEVEMPLLVQRRLRAMEDYFVKTLRESYEFHEPLRRQNARELCAFQVAVVDRAAEKLAERLAHDGDMAAASTASTTTTTIAYDDDKSGGCDDSSSSTTTTTTRDGMPGWLLDVVTPYVEALRAEEREAAAEAARRAAAAAAQREADATVTSQTGADEDDADDDAYDEDNDDDDEEEEAAR